MADLKLSIKEKVPWFMEYDGDRTDVLWLWDGWAPCLDAWKAMSCCSRGRLKRENS